MKREMKNIQTQLEIADFIALHNRAVMKGLHLRELVKEILLRYLKEEIE